MPARLPKVGSTYYFRRAVPEELRPYFLTAAGKPRTEFMISLGEKDLRKAKDKWLARAVEVAAWLRDARDKLRRGIHPDKAPPVPQPPNQSPWASQEEFEHWEEGERWWAEQDASREAGLAADPLLRAREEGAQAALARRDRQDQEAREAFAEDVATSRAPLMDLFDGYVAERQPAPATVKRWRPVITHLIAHLGHDDARRIKQRDLVAWKDALLAERIGGNQARIARTVRETYVASLKVVLAFAKDNGAISANPALGVTVRVPTRVTLRDPEFTSVEALTILRASLKPQSEQLTPEHALARRWVPWLCAYTGARVNEMTQLRAEDVQQIDGIWTVRVTPDAGSVKNHKVKIIPLHPHLIEQGFLAVASAKGKGPLFYDPARGRGGSRANPQYKKVGERLAMWVRKIGVNDPEVQPNHAWRHLLKTTARGLIPEGISDALTGHAHTSEGRKYGSYPLKVVAAELAKLPRFEV